MLLPVKKNQKNRILASFLEIMKIGETE